jgi:hypothetical protein
VPDLILQEAAAAAAAALVCLVDPCGGVATWLLRIECPGCGEIGGGPTCDFHKVQAVEWGIPHPGSCTLMAPVTRATPLRRAP